MLAQAARTILTQLGLDKPATVSVEDTAEEDLYELVSKELGSDWPRQVAPSFDEEKVVLLDDRWASAREDLSALLLANSQQLISMSQAQAKLLQHRLNSLDLMISQLRLATKAPWTTPTMLRS